MKNLHLFILTASMLVLLVAIKIYLYLQNGIVRQNQNRIEKIMNENCLKPKKKQGKQLTIESYIKSIKTTIVNIKEKHAKAFSKIIEIPAKNLSEAQQEEIIINLLNRKLNILDLRSERLKILLNGYEENIRIEQYDDDFFSFYIDSFLLLFFKRQNLMTIMKNISFNADDINRFMNLILVDEKLLNINNNYLVVSKENGLISGDCLIKYIVVSLYVQIYITIEFITA